MATPAFVAQAVNSDLGETATVTLPVEASNGDRIIAFLVHSTGAAPTALPDGFTPLDPVSSPSTTEGGRIRFYEATVGDTADLDPGDTLTIQFSAIQRWLFAVYVASPGEIMDYTQGGTTTQSSSGPYLKNSPLANVESPGGALVLHIYGVSTHVTGADNTWTADAATTARINHTGNLTTFRNMTLLVADEVQESAGPTTQRQAEASSQLQAGAATIVLSTAFTRPLADAGEDQSVAAGATVELDGSASDGGGAGSPYTYAWTQTSGATVSLSDATAADPTFTAPSASDTLVFQLVVTDTDDVPSLPDTVTITVNGPEDTAVPSGDRDTGSWAEGWTKEPSEAEGFFSVVSDDSDSTYVESPANPSHADIKWDLTPLQAPGEGDTVVLTLRVSLVDATSGLMIWSLMQGASTTIAIGNTELTPGAVNHLTFTLDPEDVAGITDPDNLWLIFRAVSATA